MTLELMDTVLFPTGKTGEMPEVGLITDIDDNKIVVYLVKEIKKE